MGLLAHVDTGKTTLSEALLYLSGKIRKLGRVDHKDAYLDTSPLERERGITIFSKQAVLEFPETRVTILDTPGHVDFSAEMERTLQVLDYAVLLINGADGVQGHTVTLWKLLERYQIPTFIFVNKMDQEGTDHDALLTELKKRLNENCMDFSENENPDGDLESELPAGEKEKQNLMENKFSEEFLESLAMCDEKLLEKISGNRRSIQGRDYRSDRRSKGFSMLFWLCTENGRGGEADPRTGQVHQMSGIS